MYKYNIKFYLSILLFSLTIFSCSDSVDSNGDFNDLVKSDSLDTSKDSFLTTTQEIAFRYMKGPFPSGIMEIEIEGEDSVYSVDIGSYSTATITRVIATDTTKALSKSGDNITKKLVKTTVIGETLNEFVGVLIGVELDAFTTMDDTATSIKTNIIHTAIAMHMDGKPETVEQYELSEAQVRLDMKIPSWLDINSNWDDLEADDSTKGTHLAIAGRVPEEMYSKLHITTYENFIASLMYSPSTFDDIGIYQPLPEGMTNDEFSDLHSSTSNIGYIGMEFMWHSTSPCRLAKQVMNTGYRGLVYSEISDEVEQECLDYHMDLYREALSTSEGI